jgi:NADPH:quinone reductase-like Zn-dependent oxidoreductase
MARLEGARITALASGPKLGYVRALGAEEALDYREHDVAGLHGRWDIVLDAAGAHPFARLRGLLEPHGVMVSTRPLGRDTLRLLGPARRHHGPRYAAVMTKARSQDLARLVTLIDSGELTTVLDRTFPMTAVVDAHRWAETSVTGKVVLEVAA